MGHLLVVVAVASSSCVMACTDKCKYQLEQPDRLKGSC